jgi:hypothetical protein
MVGFRKVFSEAIKYALELEESARFQVYWARCFCEDSFHASGVFPVNLEN